MERAGELDGEVDTKKNLGELEKNFGMCSEMRDRGDFLPMLMFLLHLTFWCWDWGRTSLRSLSLEGWLLCETGAPH